MTETVTDLMRLNIVVI